MDQKNNLSQKGLSVEYYGEEHEDCLGWEKLFYDSRELIG